MGAVELEPRLARALCSLATALENQGVPYALIGATALLLRGVRLDRTTRDLDLAVSVGADHPTLYEILHKAGFQPSARVSHRFIARDGHVQVDVLSLDSRARALGRITFPEGGAISAAGLSEAITHATAVPVSGCRVRVAPLPVLVVLKLLAAVERRFDDRDLQDAYSAMRDYASEGDRRFLEVNYDGHSNLVWETAGAFLIARDSLPLLENDTVRSLRQAAGQLLDDPRLSEDRPWGERLRPLLQAYVTGLGLAE